MALLVLLDEHISPTVALRLQRDGHWGIASVRDRGLIGWEDWQLMAWCTQNQYAIFTNNEADWEDEHERSIDRGEDHFGILIAGNWTTEEYYWALRQYLEMGADPPPTNRLVHISRASDEFIRNRSTS